MGSGPLYTISVVAATVTGTAGVVLSALTYRQYAGSPFGRVFRAVPAFAALFTLYHAVLLVSPSSHLLVEFLESAAFAFLAAFAVGAVWVHARMSQTGGLR